MRNFFKEYGQTIISVVVALGIFSILFTGIQIYDVLKDVASVEENLQHSYSGTVIEGVNGESNRDFVVFSLTEGTTTKLSDSTVDLTSMIKCISPEGEELPVTVSEIWASRPSYSGKLNLAVNSQYYNSNNHTLNLRQYAVAGELVTFDVTYVAEYEEQEYQHTLRLVFER